jgi:anti-sigma regulatory factor (Ser/Thr protein kinase)
MNLMAPTRPVEPHSCRAQLTTGPAAAGQARSQLRAAINAWDITVDLGITALLTSELVTNAIQHEATGIVVLAITRSPDELRVDVHDTSSSLPMLVDAAADAEAGRGLMLVATLAAQWGYYRTPAGKAVEIVSEKGKIALAAREFSDLMNGLENLPEVEIQASALAPGIYLQQAGIDSGHIRLLADVAGTARLPSILVQQQGVASGMEAFPWRLTGYGSMPTSRLAPATWC